MRQRDSCAGVFERLQTSVAAKGNFERLRERYCGHGAQQAAPLHVWWQEETIEMIVDEEKPPARVPALQKRVAPAHFCGELFADGADEIGEETVAGGVDAGVVFDEAEAEDVEVEADGGAAAFEIGERVRCEEQFGLDAAIDAGAAAFGATDELVTHSGIAHGADFFFAEIANAGAADLIEF
jgi:hypothetical protein